MIRRNEMHIARALGFAVALTACGRSSTAPGIVADPLPADAGPTPNDTPLAPSPALVLDDGKVIDLAKRSVVHVLVPGPKDEVPKREASHGDVAYLVTKAGPLQAFSLTSGAPRWTIATAPCSVLAAAEGGAFCGRAANVTMYDALTGTAKALVGGGTADVQQLLAVAGHVLVLRTDLTVDSYDGKTGALAATATYPFMPYGFRDGLVANAGGACGVAPVGPEVELACVDALGASRFRKTYPIRKPTDPSATWFLVRELDARWLVVSTWSSSSKVERGVVVRVADGVQVARVEEEISAAVTGPDGGLDAMIVTQPSLRVLDAKGALRWTSTEKLEEGASAVLTGSTLVVASYHPIATGAELRGFDALTGKLRWTGQVELLPIAHSKYSNHVTLEMAYGHVVMHGHEASQRYLEIFDPADGKRELTEVHSLW